MEPQLNDFTIVEVRLIQSMWETKAPEYIAFILDRPFAAVERKIKELNQVCKVKLHERPQFTRKMLQKQKDDNYLKETPIKIADNTNKISVRIDSKTVVFVAPGTDVEKYKKDYFKRKLKL